MERALHFCLPPPRCGISDDEAVKALQAPCAYACTLTCHQMDFLKCSIAGASYGAEHLASDGGYDFGFSEVNQKKGLLAWSRSHKSLQQRVHARKLGVLSLSS
ncbi:hypothetical protein MUK42_11718 [Musa troglodytarum]|uniref:Uncharacterized protein n=1 Tax=Musa troglodytarum TaxID=320322 RepID=A0A9E7FTM2_9LILI|nr:hypothetical protein MUK42_11718 [Musa troglodytarum]